MKDGHLELKKLSFDLNKIKTKLAKNKFSDFLVCIDLPYEIIDYCVSKSDQYYHILSGSIRVNNGILKKTFNAGDEFYLTKGRCYEIKSREFGSSYVLATKKKSDYKEFQIAEAEITNLAPVYFNLQGISLFV